MLKSACKRFLLVLANLFLGLGLVWPALAANEVVVHNGTAQSEAT